MKRLPKILLGIATILVAICVAVYFFLAPARGETFSSVEEISTEVDMTLQLTSDAFEQEQPIPAKYTCIGEASSSLKDISPALAWGEPPEGTQSFALIMDDLDSPGGVWVHWVIFNIPASARGLPESVPASDTLPNGSLSGNNSWGRTGYGGPCPPSGTHRYVFKLYALDEMLVISAGSDKGELEKAMVGHILAQGELMGTFTK
jgi:Raf kinase inhibitor-like YbhB/YbcL family protein